MDEGLKALLAAIADYGTQDVYTDAWEYETRTGVCHALASLAGRVAEGYPVLVKEVEAITAQDIDNPDEGDDDLFDDEDADFIDGLFGFQCGREGNEQ